MSDGNFSKAAKDAKAAKETHPRKDSKGPHLRVESPLSDDLERLVYGLIGIAMEVHSALGPGLREGVYEDAFVIALEERRIDYVRQVPFKVSFRGQPVRPIRVDLVVAGSVIVELKAVSHFHDLHASQMMTYLKLTRLPVGILLNFNVRHMRDGIRRFLRR
jgi:GxxExxY protein